MQPFKKILASLGVGTAKIDTQLHTAEIRLGEPLHGQLIVTGGSVAQHINDIYIIVKTKYRKLGLDTAYFTNGTVCHFKVVEAFTIESGETKHIPFSLTLPLYTPVTDHLSVLWLQTHLDIQAAIDQEDEDYLIVTPFPFMQSVLSSIESIGFQKQEVVCEDSSLEGMLPFDTGFYQVFRFIPTTDTFKNIHHINIVLNPLSLEELEITFEIHRTPHNAFETMKEQLGLDVLTTNITVTQQQVHSLKQLLTEHILNITTT